MYSYGSHNPIENWFKNYQQFLDDLLFAIADERAAIDFYQRLYEIAPTEMAQYSLEAALNDEKKHDKQLTFLYKKLTGQEPDVKVEKVTFHHFYDGLEKAFIDEVEAYEFYKDMAQNAKCQSIRDLLYTIQHDEIEHATLFNWVHCELR